MILILLLLVLCVFDADKCDGNGDDGYAFRVFRVCVNKNVCRHGISASFRKEYSVLWAMSE